MSAAQTTTQTPNNSQRIACIRKINVGKKVLQLEEDNYRAILKRITGNNSLTQCSIAQMDKVLAEFKRLGFKPKPFEPKRKAHNEPFVGKIYALWRNMAFLNNRSDEALRAYTKRMTGVDTPEFLTPKQGQTLIECLKQWQERDNQNTKPTLPHRGTNHDV